MSTINPSKQEGNIQEIDFEGVIDHQEERIIKEQGLLEDLNALRELAAQGDIEKIVDMIASGKQYRGGHGLVSATSLKDDERFGISFIEAVLPDATDIRLAPDKSGFQFSYDDFDFAYEFGSPDRFVALFSYARAYERANASAEKTDDALQADQDLDDSFKTAIEFDEIYRTLLKENVIDEDGNLIDHSRHALTRFAKMAMPNIWDVYDDEMNMLTLLMYGFDEFVSDNGLTFDLFVEAKRKYACMLKSVFAIERVEDVIERRFEVVDALREKLVKRGFALHERSDVDDVADNPKTLMNEMTKKESIIRDGIVKFENVQLFQSFNVEREKLAVGKFDKVRD